MVDKRYDYLIVGAGLFGSVFACEAKKRGKSCLVVEKNAHIAGSIYTKEVEGINVHVYGAHVFHTSNKQIWDYINTFATFKNFVNTPVAVYKDELYNLPFNMNTFSKIWGVITPAQAKAKIEEQTAPYKNIEPKNLEEQALSLVGKDIYEKLIKCYTEKQWGRPCTELPPSIIKRLPIRYTYNNNYFNDIYQGVPEGGYTKMVENMLSGIDVLLNTDYAEFIKNNPNVAERTVFTGMIDAFFDFKLGHLQYRTVRLQTEVLDADNFQGNAIVNYTTHDVPFTRIIEHKHFEYGTQPKTIISREYPEEWTPEKEPYYPIHDKRNTKLYNEYLELAKTRPDVIFGGRLGSYAYYDMDKVVAFALSVVDKEFK